MADAEAAATTHLPVPHTSPEGYTEPDFSGQALCALTVLLLVGFSGENIATVF